MTTPGFTNRHLRHRDGLARTDVLTAGSPATDRLDATFCPQPPPTGGRRAVSLESLNHPGHFWRHSAEAVHIATAGGDNTRDDNPGGCAADTTWADAAPPG